MFSNCLMFDVRREVHCGVKFGNTTFQVKTCIHYKVEILKFSGFLTVQRIAVLLKKRTLSCMPEVMTNGSYSMIQMKKMG